MPDDHHHTGKVALRPSEIHTGWTYHQGRYGLCGEMVDTGRRLNRRPEIEGATADSQIYGKSPTSV